MIKNKKTKTKSTKKSLKNKKVKKSRTAKKPQKVDLVYGLVPKKKKIIDFKRETSINFTLKLDWKVKHDPGQFMMVGIPGIGECPISICSYSDQYVELSIREVGNVTKALGNLKKGGFVFARGPFGRGYPMHYFKGNNVIIVGGGCGIAPLKGVIEYITKNRTDFKDVLLYLGYRSPDDVIFEEQLKSWEKKFCLNVSYDKAPAKSCYDGKVGFVTELIRKSKFDNKNKIVFICGPPIMMETVINILKKKKFNNDQIYISAERRMQCGGGKCGHCMIHGVYVCKDGPVFRYDELMDYKND
ncbi:FAD/NAD(P)-binding protein [Candidatus Woesearchaeota archaeon]|jgi:anaerobic sulfite reductase subunit B|nr:FAD/NAD(P)-binding protein [Candidatus Woesearchaeota archaeon]MBT5272785.1 FAD/NAD(P)-binding protein [Candidatus Woesearchaeota archaeon]MBT6040397.1 FAD/NAD(P)-binding protein [Candidatus Woesearchaeota archaeon]MBT6336970.1 FAD/NAD(P)-binding protein [Candidatus Woesearchaeota archaeon]MBT7926856.1 FAD/NAD(P)-binding protein [Candidatus Woesearchaeota archaeon]